MNVPVTGDTDYYGAAGSAAALAVGGAIARPGLGAAALRGSGGGGADEEELAMDVPNNVVGR